MSKTANKRKRLIIIIGFIISLIALIFLIWRLWAVILPFFLSIILTYLLQPLVTGLQKRGLSLLLSIIIVYCFFIGLIYLLFFFAMPQLFAEMESLITFLPSLIDTIQNWWLSFLAGIERIPLPISVKGYFVNALDSVGLFIERILTNFMSGIFNYLRYILSFILAPILAFYMLRDKEKIKRKIIALLPVRERNEILRIGSEVDHLLRQFLYGYLLISLIVAVLSYAGLALIGVKYALFLGIFMGIAEMIPYFGPYIGGAPAVVLAYIQSPRLALYALIVLFIVQQLEGMVISPKILGHKTGLHPLVIIFAVLAGGGLFGILGSIFAVPVAATGIFISKYIYSRAVEYREK